MPKSTFKKSGKKTRTKKSGRQFCFGLGGSTFGKSGAKEGTFKKSGAKEGTFKKSETLKKSGSVQAFEQKIILTFLGLLNTVKLFHWKTQSYATHKATDELYSSLNGHVDKFVEVLLGKIGNRVNLLKTHTIPLKDFSSAEEFIAEINRMKTFLVDLDSNDAMNIMSNSDLYNIRDEILGDLNQTLYLLTFR
jgi:DNA-binding ferritin-like protein